MVKDTSTKYLPFRSKRKVDGVDVEYGRYKWYNPHTKTLDYLNEPEYDSAYRRTRELLDLGSQGGQAGGAPETTVHDTPAPSFNIDAAKIMDQWASDGVAKLSPPGSSPSLGATPSPAPGPAPGVSISIPRPVVKTPPKKGGLTQEQAAKLGKAVNKVAAKLNLALLSGAVKFAGRDPFELDEDDVELLALGWELFLDDFFVKNPPKPWMLIVAGNVLCASVMYLRGTPIVKEDDILITEGEPEGAPGLPRVVP